MKILGMPMDEFARTGENPWRRHWTSVYLYVKSSMFRLDNDWKRMCCFFVTLNESNIPFRISAARTPHSRNKLYVIA